MNAIEKDLLHQAGIKAAMTMPFPAEWAAGMPWWTAEEMHRFYKNGTARPWARMKRKTKSKSTGCSAKTLSYGASTQMTAQLIRRFPEDRRWRGYQRAMIY